MPPKHIRVECPCCDSRLEVDVLTERVLSWRRPEELDPSGKPVVRAEDWDAAQARVRGREAEAVDKFDQALRQERTRGNDLDALFDKLRDEGPEAGGESEADPAD